MYVIKKNGVIKSHGTKGLYNNNDVYPDKSTLEISRSPSFFLM